MKVPVRAVVAYSASGKYLVAGWSPEGAGRKVGDGELLDYVSEWLPENTEEDVLGHHFIVAEIEIPDPVPPAEVEGQVAP